MHLMDSTNLCYQRGRRGRQKTVPQPREEYQTPAFNRLGPAGEQFLKDTPWANPNHQVHKMYPPAAALPDGRPGVPVAAGRAIHGPITGSAVDRKASIEGINAMQRSPGLSGRLSESPELARSMLSSGAHQMKRVASIPSIGRGSKATAA